MKNFTAGNELSKGKIASLSIKLGEYLLFIGLACIIVYYLMKTVFGDPSTFESMNRGIHDNTSKLDTIIANNQYTVDGLTRIDEAQSLFIKVITDQNKLLQQQNKKLGEINANVKKLQYESRQNTRTTTGYNYSQIDSFFANRYNRLYSSPKK